MKKFELASAVLAVLSTAGVAQAATEFPQGCVRVIQNTAAAAGGADEINDGVRASTHATNPKVIKRTPNAAGTFNYTIKADVSGDYFDGTVVVTSNRAGCFVEKLEAKR